MKIAVKSIWMKKGEGRPGEGAWEACPTDPDHIWSMANSRLTAWGKDVKYYPPESDCHLSYDKTDFTIIWEDGEEYHGRYDLHAREQANIGKSIMRFLEWTEKNGKPEARESATEFIEKYHIKI